MESSCAVLRRLCWGLGMLLEGSGHPIASSCSRRGWASGANCRIMQKNDMPESAQYERLCYARRAQARPGRPGQQPVGGVKEQRKQRGTSWMDRQYAPLNRRRRLHRHLKRMCRHQIILQAEKASGRTLGGGMAGVAGVVVVIVVAAVVRHWQHLWRYVKNCRMQGKKTRRKNKRETK